MCSKDCLLIYMKPVRVIGQSEEKRTEQNMYIYVYLHMQRERKILNRIHSVTSVILPITVSAVLSH